MNRRRCLAALLFVLPGSACVSGSYATGSLDEPVSTQHLRALQPGSDTLASCLAALGAPNRVFEYGRDPLGASGMALLWYWRDSTGFGVQVSTAVKDASVSASFDQAWRSLPGCVLWFDAALRLERWREGTVGDLLPERPRPPVIDED